MHTPSTTPLSSPTAKAMSMKNITNRLLPSIPNGAKRNPPPPPPPPEVVLNDYYVYVTSKYHGGDSRLPGFELYPNEYDGETTEFLMNCLLLIKGVSFEYPNGTNGETHPYPIRTYIQQV